MYIRFHGNYSSTYTRQPYGVFVLIYHLKRQGKLSNSDSKLYDETVDWFEKNLPNPPFYDDNNSIRGVTWFKENKHAEKMIQKLEPFLKIAQKYGVEVIKSTSSKAPGEIVYEDDYQIGVINCS